MITDINGINKAKTCHTPTGFKRCLHTQKGYIIWQLPLIYHYTKEINLDTRKKKTY